MDKLRYKVNGKSLIIKIVAVLMALSVLFRLLGYWGFWNDREACFNYTQILIPVICCVLYAVIVLFFGEKLFILTLIPVLAGAVTFIIKAVSYMDGLLNILLCIIMSVLAAAVYIATVFGKTKNKWLLAPAFGVPLLYNLIVKDMANILAREGAMPLEDFIPELSVLCILTALLLTVFAMKNKYGEELETIDGEIYGVEYDDYVVEDDEPQQKALPDAEDETDVSEEENSK